jgi:hypothetical protein
VLRWPRHGPQEDIPAADILGALPMWAARRILLDGPVAAHLISRRASAAGPVVCRILRVRA